MTKSKIWKFLSALMVLMLLFQVLPSVPVLAEDTVVTFPDANLESVVRQAISKPTGNIYTSDVAGLTSLSAPYKGIINLTGIQYCTSLTHLELYNNQISDIAPLAGLTNLTYLWLTGNKISDLTPLASLNNLIYLWLDANQISDLGPLAGLTNITDLGLIGNQISNLAPLGGLTSLINLSLISNQVSDLTPLAGLTSLKKIELSNNQISDLAPLAGLTNLTDLYMSGNQISDLAPLTGLTNLIWLNLSYNQISDIAPLVSNAGLGTGDTMNLRNNPLSTNAVTVGIPALRARGVAVQYNTSSAYDSAAACSYANTYCNKVCSDGYFWTTGSTFASYTAGDPVPTGDGLEEGIGNDGAHFVSCCIGSPPNGTGGGLVIPSSTATYGEPGAEKLGDFLLDSGIAENKTSVSDLVAGDVINYDFDSNGTWDQVAIYLGSSQTVAVHSSYYSGGLAPWNMSGVGSYRFLHIVATQVSSSKAITAFNFNALSPVVTGVVNENTHTIALTVPAGTNVTALVPTITYTGASVNPASGAAHDFTNPVTYTVTSADATTQDYTVTVTVAAISRSVMVTSPLGSEFWLSDSQHAINWVASGTGWLQYDLEYSTDGGISYKNIHTMAEQVNGNSVKTYTWKVPNVNSINCMIRVIVTDLAEDTMSHQSGAFTIMAHRPVLLVHGLEEPLLAQNFTCESPPKDWKVIAQQLTGKDIAQLVESGSGVHTWYKLESDAPDGFYVYMSNYSWAGDTPSCTPHDIQYYAKNLQMEIEKIKEKTRCDKVDIVAHSMGGLVARAYIEDADLPDLYGVDYGRDVGQLIMLGTPNHGSPLAALSPYIHDGIYGNQIISEEQLYENSDFLNDLNKGNGNGGAADNYGVHYTTIAGNGISILSIVFFIADKFSGASNDGVVSVESVKISSADNSYIYPVGHFDFCINPKIGEYIRQVLLGQPVVLERPHILNFKCPVHITITDNLGRSISDNGPNTIPGASVTIDTVNDLINFYLPPNLTYTIDIASYDNGQLSIMEQLPSGDTNTVVNVFNDIELTENTKVNLDVVNGSDERIVNIDYDGNGEVDSQKNPDITATYNTSGDDIIISTPPSAPTLIAPTEGAENQSLTPILEWDDVSVATTYRVQVSAVSSFATTVLNRSGLTASTCNVPFAALNANTTYYWRASAVNEAGSSPWSAIGTFKTVAQSPTDNWTVTGTPGFEPSRNDILNPVIDGLPTGSDIHDMASGNDGLTLAAVVTVNGKAFDYSYASTPLSIIYSTNSGGIAWSTDAYSNLIHAAGWQSGSQVFNIAIAPDDSNTWLASAGSAGPKELWLTVNSGLDWQRAFDGTGLGDNETIRNIDMSIDYGGKRDLGFVTTSSIGGRWAVAASTDLTAWRDQLNVDGAAATGLPNVDTLYDDIRFSPTYNGDSSVALVYSTADATYFQVAWRDLGANTTLQYAYLTPGVEVKSPESPALSSPGFEESNNVSLQLPSDFSGQSASLRRAYVSLDAYNHKAAGVVEDGVYRVDDTTVYVLMNTTAVVNKSIYSIAYFGTSEAGKLLTGERMGFPSTATVQTWFTDSPTSSPIPCWYPALKSATGAANQGTSALGSQTGVGGPIVGWNADGSLGLCTTGSHSKVAGASWYVPLLSTPVPNDESAFSISRNNGETWNQLGLIDTTIDWLNDVASSNDGTTVYLASANRDDGSGCDEFDSVWRSTVNPNVAAPVPVISTIGVYWERVYCHASAGNSTIAQSDLPVLRVVNSRTDKPDGEIVGWAAQGAYATAGNTGGVMAWSPDFGEYWAVVIHRDPVQDFAFSSSANMYVVSPGGMVQHLPYTGTKWSTDLPSYSTGLSGAHTIVASVNNNVLVGASASANAAGYAASFSQDSGVTWSAVQQKLPTNGNVHVAFDLNSYGDSIIYAADDNGPVLNTGSPHVAGSLPGAVYRNTVPASTAWVNTMSLADGASGPDWWPSTADGDPPHNVGQFGVAAIGASPALYSAHDKVSLQSAAGPTSLPAASAVCYTGSVNNAMPLPGVYWQCLDSYSNAGLGSTSGDTVRFTLEPSSLKTGGSLVLYAIDDEAFGRYLGTTTGYSPAANPPVRGSLWACTVDAPSGTSAPVITNAGGATDITSTTARLNANLTSNGNSETTVTVYWGPNDGVTTAENWTNHADMGIISAGLVSVPVTGLTAGATYYYRSYASNAAGNSWAGSSASFSTGLKPAAPGLTYPVDNSTVGGTSINFQWTASTGASNYWLTVQKVSDGTFIKNTAVDNVTSYSVAGFPNNGTQYRWTVAAANSAGWGTGAAYQLFTNAVAKPAAPVLTSPADNSTIGGTSVTFTWNTSTGAANYWLTVQKISDGTFIKNTAVGNVTTFTVPGFPNNGTQYRWVVAAGNSAGWGKASAYQSFTNATSKAAAPVLTSPAADATLSGTSITFTWNASTGATNYWLTVQKISDGTFIKNTAVGNVTTLTVAGFPNNGAQYRWTVAAANSSGWGTGAASRTFTNATSKPAAPVLVSPTDGATMSGTTIPFTWNASSGATNYWLTVQKVSDGTFIKNTAVGNVTNLAVAGFPNNGAQYRWTVAAGNSSGWGTGAASQTFTNATSKPAAPVLTSPAADATVSGTTIPFTWNASSGATNYWLTVQKVSDGTFIKNTAVGNVTTLPVAGFPNNGAQYRWTVAAGNSSGWGTGAASRSFTNTTAKPAAPVLVSPAASAAVNGTSVTFTWNASTGATGYWLTVQKISDGTYIKNAAVGNVTTLTVAGFPNNGTQYTWTVAAGNSAGWGSAAANRTFTSGMPKPAAPVLSSPAADATVSGTSIPFTWNASSGATNYWLAVQKVSDGTFIKNTAVGNVTTVTVAGFPNDGTQYRWTVAAASSAGWGTGAAYQAFTNGP